MHKKEGGVICYITSSLTVKIEKQDLENYDIVYVDITTKRNRKLTIGTVYRPSKFQAADDTAIKQKKEIVIIGDFNCPNVD